MTTTDQHKRTFALRDDLAEVLREEIEGDGRVDLRVDNDEHEQFYADLAESLIARGWVVQYPESLIANSIEEFLARQAAGIEGVTE